VRSGDDDGRRARGRRLQAGGRPHGDIAGATQQIAELGFLLALLIAVPAVTR
jgi:cobalamin synthase